MEFLYNRLSKKRLEDFKPSKTLGDELKIQRNYYDVVTSGKNTTNNKSVKLTNFLKNISNKEILDRFEDIKALDKYLDDQYKKICDVGINAPSRITELEKESNSKLNRFTRSNYFTSYYCLFRLYGFLTFNSLLKLLKRYDVQYKYSDTKILDLPKNFKPEFNILKNNQWGYSFYSFIVPLIKMLNEHEKVEVSLNIGEPSYFLKDILEKNITTITYGSAKRLLEILNVEITGTHTLNEFLKEFNILDDETFRQEKEFENYMEEQDYTNYCTEQELIPINFNYIYNKNSCNEFTFRKDINIMIDEIQDNLQKYVSNSFKEYNIDKFLNVFKILTTLKELIDNIEESENLLCFPLQEEVEELKKLYVDNISKEYFSKPLTITLLDDINPSEDGEVESLSVCIPKLQIDFNKNLEKYPFKNYFKAIYSKK